MEYAFNLARWLHIIGGFTALIVFWLPIVTRKGRKVHIRSGWIFVIAMTCVSITALYMGIYRLTWDSGTAPDAIPFSWFLIFIAILSGATAWDESQYCSCMAPKNMPTIGKYWSNGKSIVQP